MIKMKNITIYLSLFLFFVCLSFMQAQEVSNVRVSTTDRDVLVTYDLSGETNKVYDVQLSFKQDDGSSIKAETIKGDIGDVVVGKDKVAIWKVYEDVNGLQGGIEPVFVVKPIALPIAKKADPKSNPTPTPTPPNTNKDTPIIDIIDKQINGKDQVHRTGLKLSLGNSRASVTSRAGEFSKDFSFQAGIYHRYNFNRKIYIQPELLFHRQRYAQAFNNNRLKYTHNQIRGQAIAGIKPIGLGLYFNAGLYYAYQLNGKQNANEDGNDTETSFSDFPEMNNESEPFNTTDFGYILGGTLSFNRGGFALSVLFSKSFDSVLNDAYYAGDTDFENQTLRHQSVHFVIQKKF